MGKALRAANRAGRADPQPAAIPEQEFQAIPLRVGEQEHMPAQRIAQQPVARQTVEALEPLAHVRGPRRQIDPCRRPPAEHGSEPLQHIQQLHQCGGVKPVPDLDSTAAPQCHRQTAAGSPLQHRAAG